MNGVPMDQSNLNAEDFEEALMMAIMKETTPIQKAIYHNKLKDEDDCLDYLMKQPNIMPRLNDRILKVCLSVITLYFHEILTLFTLISRIFLSG